MAKEVKGTLKLQIQAGQANPSPPVGPALGQAGVNIMQVSMSGYAQVKSKHAKERGRKTEKDRERQTKAEKDRQTEKQTDRQTHWRMTDGWNGWTTFQKFNPSVISVYSTFLYLQM